VLLFLWLNQISGAFWRSLVVALLFAVHPLHVESVAWVSERKDVLSMLFFLLTLIAYQKYCQTPGRSKYLLIFVPFILGLLSSAMLVMTPLVLLLLDEWPGSDWDNGKFKASSKRPTRRWKWRMYEKIPFVFLALIVGVVTILAQGTGVKTTLATLEEIPIWARGGNALNAYAWYLIKTLVPTGLCAVYSHPMRHLAWHVTAASAICITLISVLVISVIERRPSVAFGWCWFLLTLLPVIGILQVGDQAYADRYSYLPQIGLLIGIVWQAERWLRRKSWGRLAGQSFVAIALIGFSLGTIFQIGYWKQTETVWNRAITASGENWSAHQQLGALLLDQRKLTDATEHFQAVANYNPDRPEGWAYLGQIHQMKLEWKLAAEQYEKALLMDAAHELSMHNLLVVLDQQNNLPRGRPFLERYTRRRPLDVKMSLALGQLLKKSKDFKKSLEEYERAVKLAPDNSELRTNMGIVLLELDRITDAQTQLEEAVRLQPDSVSARINLSELLVRLKNYDEAIMHLEVVLQVNSQDPDARLLMRRIPSIVKQN
jgi:tetratricopeptide (TPR) repeat protein